MKSVLEISRSWPEPALRRIAVFGATGSVGEHVVIEALGKGLEVNALVADPRKISRFNERFSMFEGDLSSGQAIDATLQGCSAVVWTVDLETSVRVLPGALLRIARRRVDVFVFVSCPRCASPLSRLGLVRSAPEADLAEAKALLLESCVPSIVLRSAALTDGMPSGHVVIAPPGGDRLHAIPRTDFARVALSAVERSEWIGQELVVGTRP